MPYSALTQLKALPTGVGACRSILNLLQNDEVGIRALTQEIDTYPEIAARVIGIANSSFFGRSGRIHTSSDAVIVIGMGLTRQLMLSLALAQTFDARHCPAFDARRYWSCALMTATAAQQLADHLQVAVGAAAGEVYFIGLLHNIGLHVLAHLFPVAMNPLLDRVAMRDDSALCVAEREAIGIDHHRAAGWVLRRWKLPEELIVVVENYPDEDYQGTRWALCQLVRGCADMSCDIMADDMTAESDDSIFLRLGIPTEKILDTRLRCIENRSSLDELSRIIVSG